MKTKLLLLLLLANFSIYAQYTAIPDVNFEKKLIAIGIDDIADGQVLTSKIATVTSLNLYTSSITDLTGIQDFVALEKLDCSQNKLTNLDLTKNLNLTFLDCYNNSLSFLDLTSNTLLLYLDCSYNNLSVLDVSKNINLLELNVRQRTFSNLDITKNTVLKKLQCSYSNLSSLDVSKNTALEFLDCDDNKLSALDVKANTLLINLDCSNNQLTMLDVSYNPSLVTLNCSLNQLKSLKVNNGMNANLLASQFVGFTQMNGGQAGITYFSSFKNNVNLNCIQVDDVDYANTNWSSFKETTSYFSPIDCASVIGVPDSAFEDKLMTLGIDTDGKNGIVFSSSINTVTVLDVSNSLITDLTGIQGFTALTTLDASNNLFKKIDLSKNNVLTTLNVSNNTALTCIQVQDIAVAENWSTTKDNQASFSLDCEVYTLIPDSKFEEKLIALRIDKDGLNGKVKTESISEVTTLDLNESSISDLTGIEGFTSLKKLDAVGNKLITADFSKNVELNSLSIARNQLTTLNISKNVALTDLVLVVNQLKTLDVSNNLALSSLNFRYNTIQTIDLTKNTELSTLYADYNKLTNLDLSQNTKLSDLRLPSNSLVSLDVTKNTELKTLYCQDNQINTLDLSKNTKLIQVIANNNNLVNLNIKNGFNSTMTSVNNLKLNQNPNLACIEVDDVAFSNANWATAKDATAVYSSDPCPIYVPAYTLIPDANFEQKLIALAIDDIADGKVLTTKINTLTSLNVSSSLIADLTGIQDFLALTDLNCSYNTIITLDISKNTALTSLNCSANKISSLDTANNTDLTSLDCSSNQISNLDLTNNVDLIDLDIYSNKVIALDISKSTNLKFLGCSSNEINALDISLNTNLKTISCNSNNLTDLNLGTNTLLEYLDCADNNLKELDLSKNSVLKAIICYRNSFKNLDLSKQTALEGIICDSNKSLTSLNLKNGNNSKLLNQFIFKRGNSGSTKQTSFKNNTALKCILVDDVTYSTTNWTTFKDVSANFNVDCTAYTLIPDSNFEQALIALGIDTDGKNGKVLTESINTITTLDVNRSNITDLTGLQDFTLLESLSCYNNNLISLDVSKNLKLVTLECMSSTLTTLDVSKNIALENLYCYSNDLTTLDVSKNINLKILDCHFNNLTTLNLKNGFNTNFTTLDVSSKVNLPCILVDDEIYSNANWGNYKNLNSTFSNNCDVYTMIPDSNFEQKLIDLGIDLDGKNGKVLTSSIAVINDLNVQLSEINDLTGIEGFASLQYLNCQFNNLTTLDLSGNLNLIELYCHGNVMTSLNVSANAELTTLQTNKNKLTDLDVSKNTKLVYINTSENALKTLNLKNGNNTNFEGALLFKNPTLNCIMVDNPTFASTSGAFFKDETATYSSSCSLGIEESVFDKVVLYPNPTKGEVNIQNISLEKASVYNTLGQLVKTVKLDTNNDNHIVDLSGLPKGIYYIYLINQDAASAKKIIVE